MLAVGLSLAWTLGPVVVVSAHPELIKAGLSPEVTRPVADHGCDDTRAQPQEVPPIADVDLAIADLAARLGVDPQDIVVVADEDVVWSDSSLGCPQPGRAYLQVLTPGERIILELDGVLYQYHGAPGGPPFYCENPRPAVGDDR